MTQEDDHLPAMAGQQLARGVSRALRSYDFATLEEFCPLSGLRVDVMALGPKGEFWVIECKSSRADFMADAKWHHYLDWCDRFFWAVPLGFPAEILPAGTGLIRADAYWGEIMQYGPATPLPPALRREQTLRFARTAALRDQGARDIGVNAFLPPHPNLPQP
ncbi:MAG: MmcB family DNA repair protein [Cypionkella sp.]